MDKETLPRYSPIDEFAASRRRRQHRRKLFRLIIGTLVAYFIYNQWTTRSENHDRPNISIISSEKLQADYATCAKLRSVPQDPSTQRQRNGRYVEGHGAILIRNATVWTGEPASGTSPENAHLGKGYSWTNADVLMEHGLIKKVKAGFSASELPLNCTIYNAHGRQLTSGIVDMHSHASVDPLPDLRGWSDDNELSNDITPYVRSLDAINPLDHQIQVIKSGGVTTSLILPGSGNNMGGEAFVIKHAVGKPDGRSEISAEDMLADPDRTWRYMKMACGENAKNVYGRVGRDFGPFSRMGEAWYFRHALEQASALVSAQDDWCAAADEVGVENMSSYLPQDLQWESLGALLRGQVLLNTHCYTIPDLEAFIRHTNEFKFRIQAFHHAHQTYLVPEILRRAYGGKPPAAALFADNMYYKAEAYIASEQAGPILWQSGITPVYVSDNPVLNAQHVVFEAAKAYRNGLPYHVALAGVTSASAELLGLGERIGKVKAGYDADIVVWDSDPLSVGASPAQVWIDGTAQFEEPVELVKPIVKPLIETADTDLGLPAVDKEEMMDVVFTGITKVILPDRDDTYAANGDAVLVVRNGSISCVGSCTDALSSATNSGIKTIHLKKGHIVPPAISFGSTLGIGEIDAEESTLDGDNNDNTISRAIDGLALDTKNLHVAYSHGVTKAISAPTFYYGGFKGVSAGFLTGASNTVEDGAVWKDEVALHYALTKTDKAPSLSAAVGQLKTKLLNAITANTTTDTSLETRWLKQVLSGSLPLVINVHSADTIASLLRLKSDVEAAVAATNPNLNTENNPHPLNLILHGAAESHLLATSLAAANISVLLAPFLAFSESWDQRRSLTGAPLTNGTAIDMLHAAGVKVAIGTTETWQTRNLYLMAGIAFANGNGKISEKDALGFVGRNVQEMLGLDRGKDKGKTEFVVFDGNPLEINSRVRAVADGRGKMTLWGR
jgi:imidazolonepropionase-like amidohydrolase